jgi:tRNA-specific 2-thiouridylase
MSGGVDSSVAASLLIGQGYDVVGITMKVWPQDCLSRAEDKCCGPQAVADARAVAHALGIPHYVVDEAVAFERSVIDYFAGEYRNGRTPNPCVMCNEKMKFGKLWEKARALGADYIATGHYAVVERIGEAVALRKGRDPAKDQSYFLFSLRAEQLRRALMPLGAMTKEAIRGIARKLGLKTADKQESQEICFVPGNDYQAFLRSHAGAETLHPGGIFDTDGHHLGEHEGIEFFTIGQRKGLPGGSQAPRYVVSIDAGTNRVIVGGADDLMASGFGADRANWLVDPADWPPEITAKIRYAHPGAPARVAWRDGDAVGIDLPEPQRAVTPGQAAVFYSGDRCLGGAWIRTVSPAAGPVR